MSHCSRMAAFLTVLLLLAGCSEPRLDASSMEDLEASKERVRDALPEGRRAEFDSAYQTVALGGEGLFDLGTQLQAAAEGQVPESVRERLDERTASDIFQMSDSIQAEELEEELASLEGRVSNLLNEKRRAAEADEHLSDFQVLRARYRKRENALGMEEAILNLTVKNETGEPISRAFFTGTLQSPDRSVPWIADETFNYQVPGGVEPGERKRWQLKPNMFSEWANVDVPGDAELIVEVVELRGPDEEVLWTSRPFGEEEQRELDSLQTQLDSLEKRVKLLKS